MNDVFLHFDLSACQKLTSETIGYCRWVEERLIPSFGDWNDEIKKEHQEWIESNPSLYHSDTVDPYDVYQDLIQHVIQLAEINSYMLGMAIVGLSHLWDRQLVKFLKREFRYLTIDPEPNLDEYNTVKEIFSTFSTDLDKLPQSDTLRELRLVSNTIKHGTGSSYNKLITSRSDILLKETYEKKHLIQSGNFTLLGIDIHPTPTHFQHYKQAILDFWNYEYWQAAGEKRYPLRDKDDVTF